MASAPDKDWFLGELKRKRTSLRQLAKFMGLDPSAVSRMFSGERAMKAYEQDQIATFLGVPVAEVAAHRGVATGKNTEPLSGFGEMKQDIYKQEPSKSAKVAGANQQPNAGTRHPAFGALKGMITLLPDVDYTEPADPEWGKVYED